MPNRSSSALPSWFAGSIPSDLTSAVQIPYVLDIHDITFLHFHAYMELGICLSGRGTCIVERQAYPFREGDVQIVYPYQKHLSRSEGSEHSRWVWLTVDPPSLLKELGEPAAERAELLLRERMGLCGILDRQAYPLICALAKTVIRSGGRMRRIAALAALLEELSAASESLPAITVSPDQRIRRLEPALQYLRDRLCAGTVPTMEALAQACAMSPASFRRLFHEEMGISPQHYVTLYRMTKVRQLLLQTDTSVTEISQLVGFQDVSGLNRQFSKLFGITPREFRKQAAEKKQEPAWP